MQRNTMISKLPLEKPQTCSDGECSKHDPFEKKNTPNGFEDHRDGVPSDGRNEVAAETNCHQYHEKKRKLTSITQQLRSTNKRTNTATTTTAN